VGYASMSFSSGYLSEWMFSSKIISIYLVSSTLSIRNTYPPTQYITLHTTHLYFLPIVYIEHLDFERTSSGPVCLLKDKRRHTPEEQGTKPHSSIAGIIC